MTIRRGGGPRDGDQARPAPSGTYEPEWQPLPRRERDPRFTGRGHGHGLGGVVRFFAFALVLAAVVLGGTFFVMRPVVGDAVTGWAYDNAGALRIPFVEELVRDRLGPSLAQAPGTDSTTVPFEVLPGDTPAQIAPRLKADGLIVDERAFLFEATIAELRPKLEAGTFRLARNMTPAQVVEGLVNNRVVITVVPITFREQLRIEQMTSLLEKKIAEGAPLSLDPKQFEELASHPPAELLNDYPWLSEIGRPDGASLEGYLAAATYDLVADNTAEDLIRMMLDKFEQTVGPDRMKVAESRGLTFHQVITLASIVEREAKLDEERALIAGVYQNRLNRVNKIAPVLGADPTVFYAIDTAKLRDLPIEQWVSFKFWAPPGESLKDVALPEDLEKYNTYRNAGLPPGPICTPGLASIDAALEPDTKDKYLYFLALPDGSGKHVFAKTQKEHDANRKKYGYL